MSTDQGIPPLVEFEQRPVEDRNATIEAGCPQYVNVDYAIVTPMGSKDRIERVATEWLEDKEAQADLGRFPPDWLRMFRQKYADFKAGVETPLEGTSIKTWTFLNPAQVKNLLSWKVLTVEQLAQANQETISRIGMGGVALKQAAQDFIAQANDSGKVVAELAKLRAEKETMALQLKELSSKVEQLKAQVPAPAATAT